MLMSKVGTPGYIGTLPCAQLANRHLALSVQHTPVSE